MLVGVRVSVQLTSRAWQQRRLFLLLSPAASLGVQLTSAPAAGSTTIETHIKYKESGGWFHQKQKPKCLGFFPTLCCPFLQRKSLWDIVFHSLIFCTRGSLWSQRCSNAVSLMHETRKYLKMAFSLHEWKCGARGCKLHVCSFTRRLEVVNKITK